MNNPQPSYSYLQV